MLYKWYYYDNLYTEQECSDILKFSKTETLNHFVDKPASGKNLDVSVVSMNLMREKLSKFNTLVNQVNEEIFGFDLFNSPKSVNINYYKHGMHYPWHADNSTMGSTADTKLTAILNISENKYSGGEFQLFVGEETTIEQVNNVGSVLIFPSYMYHRVMPVLSGERISLSVWYKGPNWK